ncbi:neurofilament heavy polypeptide-like [Toxorhynchites rutilus septentrionalis]|uniref:neurofilament heavy polypeptide-like n=1 Tax=Toxorhynchites rutilus septentrionalis TaxID=329112 RepID=UPI002479C90F|nr:neurofilament heavy polypeptide-like [Toxorhynchites rutilus septentrionalis]
MNPQLTEIISPRHLRQSPTRATVSRIQPPSRNPGQARQLRPPGSGVPPGGLAPPRSDIRAPSGAALPLSRNAPPKTPSRSRLAPPLAQRQFLTSTLQKPSSSTEILLKTPRRMLPRPGEAKLIPLPGSSKLAAIPKPTRLRPPTTAHVAIPVARVVSTSLLPKPAYIKTPKLIPKSVPRGDSQLRTPLTRTRPATTPSSTATIKPPTLRTTPPTPPRPVRKLQFDETAVTYKVAGRDVEFVDWAPTPSPKATTAKTPIRKPVQRPTRAEPKQKKIYEFPEEPSVIATKQFAGTLRADLNRLQQATAEMQELKAKKGAILERLKTIYTRESRPLAETETLDMPAFRERYGVTQSPKMRQLLEVTAEWNREILENREFEEKIAQAEAIAARQRKSLRPELGCIKESPGDVSPNFEARRAQRELARRERIDNYKQRAECQKEYRRLLEERKKHVSSRRPYSREEREDIRRQYQEAQEFTYIAPTEEELDKAIKMAEIMELTEKGVSLTDSPEKTVECLFPETVPTTEIVGAAGDAIVPENIPVEEINTINSLDRATAEIALNASLVPAPSETAAKVVLEKSMQKIATKAIQAEPQKLDSFYDIDLKLNRPKKENFIQLQGSSLPTWFPGYHVIFPGYPGLIQTTNSPGSVLLTASRKFRPSSTASM